MNQYPEDYSSAVQKARAFAKQNNFLEAAKYYEVANNIQFGKVEAISGMIINTMNAGMIQEAGSKAKYFFENAKANPGFLAQMQYIYGISLLHKKQISSAVAAIDSAFESAAYIEEHKIPREIYKDMIGMSRKEHPGWDWLHYEQLRHFQTKEIKFQSMCEVLFNQNDDTFFIQIGACDGKIHDPIQELVRSMGWKGILVEPIPEIFSRLKENYSDVEGLLFENVAVSEQSGTAKIFQHKSCVDGRNNDDSRFGLSSLYKNRNSLLIYSPEEIVEREIITEPLQKIFDKNNIEKIDVYVSDTEGHDYHIFKQIDLDIYSPTIINIELWCVPYRERIKVFEKLINHGYSYYFNGMDLCAIKRRSAGKLFMKYLG